MCEHLIAFFSFQHPVFQHHFIRIPGLLRIVTRLPSLLTPIGPCFEAVVIIHSVRIHPHHLVSPASHILSHLSSVVSSLAVFIYYYYLFSSIFIKSPALPCIVHTLPLPPCNKTLLKPNLFCFTYTSRPSHL